MKKIIAILIMLTLIFPVYAFTLQGSQYKITGTIGSGTNLTGSNYKLNIVVGETSGKLTSNHVLCIGFLCIPFQTEDIIISGKLGYSNGTILSNGRITAKIKYGLYTRSATNTTDQYGNFTVTIKHVLKSVAESDFTIELLAEKDITALYSCKYNQTTGYCK